MKSLLTSKLFEAHHAGGFSVNQHTLESTATKGLHAIGTLTTGVHFYTNGIDRNAIHALRIARHLVGRPTYHSAHIAVIVPKDSIIWNEFVFKAVPAMLVWDMIPFLYFVTCENAAYRHLAVNKESCECSPPLPVRAVARPSGPQGMVESRECPNFIFYKLRESFGISVESYDMSDPLFLVKLKEHHIDHGLLLASAAECSPIFRPTFLHQQIFSNPPICLLIRVQNGRSSAAVDLDGHKMYETKERSRSDEAIRVTLSALEGLKDKREA